MPNGINERRISLLKDQPSRVEEDRSVVGDILIKSVQLGDRGMYAVAEKFVSVETAIRTGGALQELLEIRLRQAHRHIGIPGYKTAKKLWEDHWTGIRSSRTLVIKISIPKARGTGRQ